MTAPPQGGVALIACPAVVRELADDGRTAVRTIELDVGLHRTPSRLTAALQQAIGEVETDPAVTTVVLGYGLCSNAVLGLHAGRCPLVVPRVDDCVALVLGSNEAFAEQARVAAGTYYLSRGWIESQSTIFHEHEAMAVRYGQEKATRLTRLLLAHYTRLVLVDTGRYDLTAYRHFGRDRAATFDLAYEEIAGTTALVDALLDGPWDDRFVVVPPGGEVTFAQFHRFTSGEEDPCPTN
ncbi:MAG: DUF1638 domain-containing protein [Thermoleophilia bacterium]